MTKNLLFSGIAGTIVYYLLGWLVYGFLFPDLASGDESPLGILLGCLFYTFIYAVILPSGQTLLHLKQDSLLD